MEAMLIVVLLALVVLLSLSVMVPAALKMQRLKAYPLAIIASILAMLVFPGNVIGLPIGIWSLIVLSRPDVRAAFGRPVRSPTARETRLGITAFILSLCAVPIAVLVGVVLEAVLKNDPSGLAEIAGLTTFFLVEIPAWILGIVAWRSAWGKAAALVVPLLLLLLLGWSAILPASRRGLRPDTLVLEKHRYGSISRTRRDRAAGGRQSRRANTQVRR